jgi:hypothetical protein
MLGNKHSQAAQMTLTAGQTEGGPTNRHHGADQWLYVVSGNERPIRWLYRPARSTKVTSQQGMVCPLHSSLAGKRSHGSR